MPDTNRHAIRTALDNPPLNEMTAAQWERQEECVDEALRATFPASDPPSTTPIIGVGGCNRDR